MDIELIKVGGQITSNNLVDIGESRRPALEVLVEVLRQRTRTGRKLVLVPSAHKFGGYGVTDFLEQPQKTINYLRTISASDFSGMDLASPELKALREDTDPDFGTMQSLPTGLLRYREMLYRWHVNKANEFGVADEAVRGIIFTVCNKVRDRADSLYRLDEEVSQLRANAADVGKLVKALQHGVETLKRGHVHIPPSAEIDQLTKEVLTSMRREVSASLELGIYLTERARALDRIITCGEPLSTILIAQYLNNHNISNYRVTPREVGILTNRSFGGADMIMEATKRIITSSHIPRFDEHDVLIVPGFSGTTFIGVDEYLMGDRMTVYPEKLEGLMQRYEDESNSGHLSITQLGRGGSESTAAVMAGCLEVNASY